MLPGYQIKVFSTACLNNLVYKSAVNSEKILRLLHSQNHFNILTTMSGFFERNYWCETCNVCYEKRTQHRCAARCKLCLRPNCERDDTHTIPCTDCNRTFTGPACYAAHKEGAGLGPVAKRRSLCSIVKRCLQCLCTVSSAARQPDNPHRCGESFCRNCRRFDLPSQHKCWMRPRKFTPEDSTKHRDVKFLYFDFETWVNQDQRLIPNLVVRTTLCDLLVVD